MTKIETILTTPSSSYQPPIIIPNDEVAKTSSPKKIAKEMANIEKAVKRLTVDQSLQLDHEQELKTAALYLKTHKNYAYMRETASSDIDALKAIS